MSFITSAIIIFVFAAISNITPAVAQSLADQWGKSLGGSRLVARQNFPAKNQSTLTVMTLCLKGEFIYYQRSTHNAPGITLSGIGQKIKGHWSIVQKGDKVHFFCKTDNGKENSFPIYLQNNGRINIGGTAYTILRGAAGC